MSTKWVLRMVFATLALVALSTVAYFFRAASKSPQPVVKFGSQIPGAIPLCLVHGSMTNPSDEQNNGISSLATMVRVRYEAHTGEQCKDIGIAHCKKHLKEGALPRSLGLTIQRQSTAEEKFVFTRDCLLKNK